MKTYRKRLYLYKNVWEKDTFVCATFKLTLNLVWGLWPCHWTVFQLFLGLQLVWWARPLLGDHSLLPRWKTYQPPSRYPFFQNARCKSTAHHQPDSSLGLCSIFLCQWTPLITRWWWVKSDALFFAHKGKIHIWRFGGTTAYLTSTST